MTRRCWQHEGYYQEANPRNQFMWPVQWLFSGRIVERDGDRLFTRPLNGERTPLIPVSDGRFRRERDLDATLVFTRDADGTMVLTGSQLYAERRPRWRVEIVRWPLIGALVLCCTPLVVAIAWVARIRLRSRASWRATAGQVGRARPRGFWGLKGALLLCPVVLAAPAGALAVTTPFDWGTQNPATVVVFAASVALPALAVLIAVLAVAALRQSASRMLVAYACMVALAASGISVYLASHGLIGLRLWMY